MTRTKARTTASPVTYAGAAKLTPALPARLEDDPELLAYLMAEEERRQVRETVGGLEYEVYRARTGRHR